MGTFTETITAPRKYQYKIKLKLSWATWDQTSLTQWVKENCAGKVWWNYTKFYVRNNEDPESVMVNLWFEKKNDAAFFKLTWVL